MKLSGVHRFNIPREQLWEALFDPTVVGECVPGLKNFTQQTADRYDVELGMRVVASPRSLENALTLLDAQ